MRVTTKKVMQWDPEKEAYVTLEHEYHEYEGPVAEMKGSSAPSTTTSTSTSKPFAEQMPHVNQIMSEAQNLYNQGAPTWFGNTVAAESADTLAARDMQRQIAMGLGGFLQTGNNALTNALGPIDVANDPTVLGYADAATAPMVEQFQQEVLPGLQTAATQAGAFGGSRAGLVNAAASQKLADTVGRTRAGIMNNAYGQQLAAQQNAMALMPQYAQMQSLPAQLLSQVGSQEQTYQQALLDAAREQHDFEQMAPWMNLQNYSGMINQFGGGQSTLTGPSGTQSPSRFSSALGGAATGASLGSFFGPPGMLIGGGVGLLGGLF